MKIFIDCGAHIGESINLFMEKWPDWKEYQLHSFEPEKKNIGSFKQFESIPNFNFYDKAVWIHDGEVTFYTDKDSNKWGGSINQNKSNTNSEGVVVNCINLSSWIINSFNIDDYIILKLDIEGAEYELIDHLIATDAIKYVDVLYLEYHSHKIGANKDLDINTSKKIKAAAPELVLYTDVHSKLNFTK